MSRKAMHYREPDKRSGDVEFWSNAQGYLVYYLGKFIGSAVRIDCENYQLLLSQNFLDTGESIGRYHKTLDDMADEIISFYLGRGL